MGLQSVLDQVVIVSVVVVDRLAVGRAGGHHGVDSDGIDIGSQDCKREHVDEASRGLIRAIPPGNTAN